MDPAVTAARHFARLVWLLVHEPANVDEQKVSLRALALAVKDGPLSLETQDDQLGANGMVVSAAFVGVGEVVARLTAHGLRAVDCGAGAGAGELLGVARLLAGAHAANDGGGAIEVERIRLEAHAIRFRVRPAAGALPDMELLDPLDDAAAPAPARARLPAADVAPRGAGDPGGLFGQFAPVPRTPAASPRELLAELAATTKHQRLDHLLDDLTLLAERAARENVPALVSEILHGIVARDAATTDPDEKRIFAMALRRVARPPVLRAVATQLPRAPERRAELMAVLGRLGDDGADAVVEQIAEASQQTDRRAYFDALLALQAGVPALIHMLGDTRWFVARNAADLLGEMQAPAAEQPLTWLLKHADERVQRSAATALMRLGTPRALQAIHDALKDDAPQMRMQAATALVARQDVRTAAALVRALDVEKDEDVQQAFLLALGRMGTADAVQRLLVAAEPERGFFRGRRTAVRVAAVQALGESRTPAALDGLRQLCDDRDQEVRHAATFALARIARAAGERAG